MHEPFGYWYATRWRGVRPDTTEPDDQVARVHGGSRFIAALAVVATIALVAFVVERCGQHRPRTHRAAAAPASNAPAAFNDVSRRAGP